MPARKTPADPADGPAYRLNSVDHALRLLLLFRSRLSVRVSEVADYLNVARSTAHRLLGMLVLDAGRRPVAAFAVAGPMQRMTPGYVHAIARALRGVAAAASADLGEPAPSVR